MNERIRNLASGLSLGLILIGSLFLAVSGSNHSVDVQTTKTLVDVANTGLYMTLSGAALGLASMAKIPGVLSRH